MKQKQFANQQNNPAAKNQNCKLRMGRRCSLGIASSVWFPVSQDRNNLNYKINARHFLTEGLLFWFIHCLKSCPGPEPRHHFWHMRNIELFTCGNLYKVRPLACFQTGTKYPAWQHVPHYGSLVPQQWQHGPQLPVSDSAAAASLPAAAAAMQGTVRGHDPARDQPGLHEHPRPLRPGEGGMHYFYD